MNRIRFSLVLLASCMVFVLTGCVSAIPELSEDETEIVTQYMADLLLKYDANYQSALLNEEELVVALEEEEKKAEEARQQAEEQARIEAEKAEASQADDIEVVGGNSSEEESGSVSATATVGDMSGALGLDNTEFDYLGYEICSQYPNDDEGFYFAMTPTAGNELLIMKFNLANISSEEYTVDMMSQGASFALSVNGSSYTPALTTLLENDLAMLMTTLPVETGKEVVLVAEVPQGTTVDSIVLYVRAEQGAKAEIELE